MRAARLACPSLTRFRYEQDDEGLAFMQWDYDEGIQLWVVSGRSDDYSEANLKDDAPWWHLDVPSLD